MGLRLQSLSKQNVTRETECLQDNTHDRNVVMKKCIKKTCKHKGELQPLSNFYRNDRASDGYRVYCKDCELERGKKRYNDTKGDWTKMIIG